MRTVTVTLYPSANTGEDLTMITPSVELMRLKEQALAGDEDAKLDFLDHLSDIAEWANKQYHEVV